MDVTVEEISGSEWISAISPSNLPNAVAGSEVEFTVSLTGQRSESIYELNYDVYLWIMGDSSALLKRVRIPISVPKRN